VPQAVQAVWGLHRAYPPLTYGTWVRDGKDSLPAAADEAIMRINAAHTVVIAGLVTGAPAREPAAFSLGLVVCVAGPTVLQ